MAKWLLVLLIFCAASAWSQTAYFESVELKRLGPTSETDKQIQTLQDHVKQAPDDYAGYDGLGSALFQKARETGDMKTIYSQKRMSVDAELLELVKAWKRTTQFPADGDWLFASPLQLGRLPWSYPHVLRVFHRAAKNAGIGKLPTHTLRHSYRSWLDAVGTPIAVQQKLMRHSDIRTTMNLYGDVVTDEMAQAHSKVVGLALSSSD